MKCDGCGKEMVLETEVALLLQLPDINPQAQRTLGNYSFTKVNVNGILTWAFCFECVLNKFLGGDR